MPVLALWNKQDPPFICQTSLMTTSDKMRAGWELQVIFGSSSITTLKDMILSMKSSHNTSRDHCEHSSLCRPKIDPCIHPLSYAYLRSGHGGNRFRRETQTSHSPALPGGSRGVPRDEGTYNPSSESWVVSGAYSQCPENLQRKSTRMHPRCSNHLSWLLSMQRSSGSIPSSLRMTELLTSLRLSPAPIRRKPFSAACVCHFILSVTTQISWT